MKLRAKILPKYFNQILKGEKETDYRQLEGITFVNTQTGEEIECEVRGIKALHSWEYVDVFTQHPDIRFSETSKIYKITLGKRKINILQ